MNKKHTVEEVAGQNTQSKGAFAGDKSNTTQPLRAHVEHNANKEAHSVPSNEVDHEHTTQERNAKTHTKANGQAPKGQLDEAMHEEGQSKFGTRFVDTRTRF